MGACLMGCTSFMPPKKEYQRTVTARNSLQFEKLTCFYTRTNRKWYKQVRC